MPVLLNTSATCPPSHMCQWNIPLSACQALHPNAPCSYAYGGLDLTWQAMPIICSPDRSCITFSRASEHMHPTIHLLPTFLAGWSGGVPRPPARGQRPARMGRCISHMGKRNIFGFGRRNLPYITHEYGVSFPSRVRSSYQPPDRKPHRQAARAGGTLLAYQSGDSYMYPRSQSE